LHSTDKEKLKLIRYHLIIPFQRPEKIQANLTRTILAEYGQKEYRFLGNNCEHFATLVVCGIPFSTQADKFKMLTNRIYLNLAKEIEKSEQEFDKMSSSETFQIKLVENKEHHTKKIDSLKTKTELTQAEQQQLTRLETELADLETLTQQLQVQADISDTTSELSFSTFSHHGSTTSLLSLANITSSQE